MAESARVTNTCTFNLTIDKKLLALRQATIDITVPSGYEISDLRKLTASLSGKADGIAAKTFENAFIGGEALDLDGLFKKLGIRCDSKANCDLLELSKSDTNTRSKLFRAER